MTAMRRNFRKPRSAAALRRKVEFFLGWLR